jgi:predicted PurR-regulated permease PerM
MWAALTAIFVVVLITIGCSVLWIVANAVGFLQPILIPVAIAVILAYLLDPVVTKMCEKGIGRTNAVLALFAVVFVSIGVLVAGLAPGVWFQAKNLGRAFPA